MRSQSRLVIRMLQLGLGLAVLAGCKSAPLPVAPDNFPDSGSSLFNIDIQAASHSLPSGQKLTLDLQGQDDQGDPVDVPTATWKSSNPAVASVNNQGVVTALKKGSVTITATSQSHEATITLNVLGPGETAPPDNGTNGGTSSFPGSDTSYPGGYSPTNGTGPVPTGGSNAPSGTSLLIQPSQPRVLLGSHLRLIAYQGSSYSTAPAAAVWRTSDPTIATVDEAGVVTALKTGTVTITASSVAYGTLRGQVSLIVSAPVPAGQLQGISIQPSHVSMNVGETFWLLANVPTAQGGYDPNVRWEVGDPSIVEVSDTGQITALAPGKTTVTAIAATYDQGNLSATIPVEVLNASSSF